MVSEISLWATWTWIRIKPTDQRMEQPRITQEIWPNWIYWSKPWTLRNRIFGLWLHLLPKYLHWRKFQMQSSYIPAWVLIDCALDWDMGDQKLQFLTLCCLKWPYCCFSTKQARLVFKQEIMLGSPTTDSRRSKLLQQEWPPK